MFNFGNIFIYEGNDYVWLHSDGKTIFAAKIIDKTDRELEEEISSLAGGGADGRVTARRSGALPVK